MAHIEVAWDNFTSRRSSVGIWAGKDEEAYEEWLNGDPDMPLDKPNPTYRLRVEDVDKLVIHWLRGPMGPPGPAGPPGMSGADTSGA